MCNVKVTLIRQVGEDRRDAGMVCREMPLPRIGDHVQVDHGVYEVMGVMLTPDDRMADAYVDCWDR